MLKASLYLFTFLTLGLKGFSQSFEGTLTYKVAFEFSENFNNEEIKAKTISTLKENGEYYDTLKVTIKNGNYLKIDNAPNGKKIIYDPFQNKLFFFTKESDIVMIASANMFTPSNVTLPEPQVVTEDAISTISNIECQKVSLKWEGVGEEVYYYSPSIAPINPELLKNHNFEYLNLVINHTKAYPVKMVKSMNNLIKISLELINIDDSKVDQDIFKIPALKKASKKQTKLVSQITGYDIMIVNE